MAEEEKQEPQESELLRIQREKYEKIIKDKNKIIEELLNEPSSNKEDKHANQKEDEEDDEEKAKKDEEERKKKRAEYYKKHLY